MLESNQIEIIVQDARTLKPLIELNGSKSSKSNDSSSETKLSNFSPPYDAIHCGASVEQLPDWMWDLLKEGGRIVLPIGPEQGVQYLSFVDKKNGKPLITKLHRVLYVPITSTSWQEERWKEIEIDPFE